MPKNKKIDPYKTPVLLTLKAYKRIVGYAIRYASDKLDSDKWCEVYGILIGSIEDNSKVIIKDAIPMVVGDRAGVKYENKQYVDMAQIDASIFERSIQDKKKDFIVGWWHSHPGFGFFFSPIDCMTQLGYQIPNRYAVGLIFDHCEIKSELHHLGIAGLRLKDPDLGISSTYNLIEVNYELEEKKMLEEMQTAIKELNENVDKVLKEIKFIDEVLRKKALAQLQRNYGLILVPKEDIIITDDKKMADTDEMYLYEWDPEFFKKSYRIPKFREKIEKTIATAYDELDILIENGEENKYQAKRTKLIKKIQNILKRPNELYDTLMDDFSKRIEKIFPLYLYLDTDERKVIEYFEERSSDYFKILDELNSRSKLMLEGFE
ncbi:MAG: Mov34/MPN/PAD-1 family protein [Candidatus Odinarchaeota archaeon]